MKSARTNPGAPHKVLDENEGGLPEDRAPRKEGSSQTPITPTWRHRPSPLPIALWSDHPVCVCARCNRVFARRPGMAGCLLCEECDEGRARGL